MATATAPITAKAKRATHLREQSRILTQEIVELRSKLAHASGALAILNDKKQKFTEEAVHGRTPKPGEIAALNVVIDEATIPFEGYTSAVKSKEAALEAVRALLATLDYELAREVEQEKRQARFQALEKLGTEAAARIADKIRSLLVDDLPALDQVRDALTREFVNVGGAINAGPGDADCRAARALITQIQRSFFDGPYLKAEREMLRAGWETRGESGLEFTIRTLRAPRQ